MSSLEKLSDLRRLIILRTIIEAGSLRRAASQLKVTPSAVSQSLSSLEKQLGQVMIIRERGEFRVTAAGKDMLAKIEPALSLIENFDIEPEKGLKIARLDLGVYESLGVDVLPKFIPALKADHPQVKLNLVVARSGVILQKLRRGELCTALVAETDGLESFQTEWLIDDELGLFVSQHSPYAQLGWQAVERLGLGLLSPGVEGHPLYFTHFLNSLGSFKPVLTSDSFEILRVAAVAGNVVSVLPKRLAQRHPFELVEITERPTNESRRTSKNDTGKHKIVVAYLDRCDPEEAKYLASLLRSSL